MKWLGPLLTAARQQVLDDLTLLQQGAVLAEALRPLDAAFFDLPERLLGGERPLLDRIIAAGDSLAREVDRVVLLGIGGSYMGARRCLTRAATPITTRFRGSGAAAGRGFTSRATTSTTMRCRACSTCSRAPTIGASS